MANEKPTVSVIIPTYNRAHLVGRAIKSVLNQTYQDFEIIVVDDGSADNTEEVVKSLKDERIRYIKHDKNRGAAAARNTGIKATRGEYIAFQDSDDEWLPEKLEKQMEVFESAPPEVGVVYTDMQRVSENGEVTYWYSPEITSGNLVNNKTLYYQVLNLGIQAVVVRKSCFDKVGLFDERFPSLEDLELFIRLSRSCRFYHIKEPLVRYYTTEGISSCIDAEIVARKLLLEKYWNEIERNRRFLAKQYSKIGFLLCSGSGGQFIQGRHYLIKAVKTYPLNIKLLLITFLSFLGQDMYNRVVKVYRKIRSA